ncbi:MAG: hypothetical protein R3282_05270 [Rhodothermales bacterium]|nr:hypothetical protein [Rhodothermales bacterium]
MIVERLDLDILRIMFVVSNLSTVALFEAPSEASLDGHHSNVSASSGVLA